MTHPATFDVMRDLLDHEIQDSNGVSCGMVDDVEIGRDPATVAALLVGGGAWQARLPAAIRLLVRAFAGSHRVRVPFAEVRAISEVIRLHSPATKLGLGSVDRRLGRWFKRRVRA